jgi:hypothetical protein
MGFNALQERKNIKEIGTALHNQHKQKVLDTLPPAHLL